MSHSSSAAAPDPRDRVARKRASRGEEILARAAELVASEGLEKLTLQRVGAAMGVVPAALYRYFPSKDALVAALQRRAVGTTHAAYVARLAAAAPALRTLPADVVALAELFTAAHLYLELPATHPDEWLLVATLLGDPRPLVSDDEARKAAPLVAAFLGDVRTRVESAASQGALAPGDATLRTMTLWAALHGALALAKARRIAPTLPAPTSVGLEALHALALGWGARPEALRRAARAALGAPKGTESKHEGRRGR